MRSPPETSWAVDPGGLPGRHVEEAAVRREVPQVGGGRDDDDESAAGAEDTRELHGVARREDVEGDVDGAIAERQWSPEVEHDAGASWELRAPPSDGVGGAVGERGTPQRERRAASRPA